MDGIPRWPLLGQETTRRLPRSVLVRKWNVRLLLHGLLLCLLWSLLAVPVAGDDEIAVVAELKFTGAIAAPEDVSAIEFLNGGQFAVIGSDEGQVVQVLRRSDARTYVLHQTIPLVPPNRDDDDEIDIEAIAKDGMTVYVLGSHSRRRRRVKKSNKVGENLRNLETNEDQPRRQTLARFRLDANGKLSGRIELTTLQSTILKDRTLRDFTRIPSKENGIDIEGLALFDGKLYAGFRAPVLRGGYVPVLKFRFENPLEAEKLYIDLRGGMGVRSLLRTRNGFLVIAGPIDSEPDRFELFLWSGVDNVPGEDISAVKPKSLGRIPTPEDAKPEGLALMKETDDHFFLTVVYDSLVNGGPRVLRVTK